MSVKKITKKAFSSVASQLISNQKTYGVTAKGQKFTFDQLQSAADLVLDYDVTMSGPKKYFLPPAEVLLRYAKGESYSSVHDTEKFVLIGVHPYDLVAISQMDELFSQDNYDSHYMTRRNSATIIACDVTKPSENTFASSMQTAVVDTGYDALLTDIGDSFIVDIATEKGAAIFADAEMTDPSEADLAAKTKLQDHNKKNLNAHELKCTPSDLPGLLDKAYDHPIWSEQAKTCFACGSCNLVCPTCYCFDVRDEVDWDVTTGDRKRHWDGCLLNGFTKVAPDHEFRNDQADRIRHRLYRKGKYVPAKIGGQIACVGCGRCVSACLTDIANPVKIYNRLVNDLGLE